MYARNDFETFGSVRSPIQCEGIERGPKRIADVATNGTSIPISPASRGTMRCRACPPPVKPRDSCDERAF